tara:strand:+ start:169 stop:384 length:216 start_codon:yes stop_codon:yes gene_type:complete
MTRRFEVEVAQTLYWLVTIDSEEDDIDDAIDWVIDTCETDDLPEFNEHWTFAANEQRDAKVLTIDGERYDQ